ncbi:hypothetical protein LEMLEM_LOCUS10762, partial [Lemmus lemmus]
TTAVGTPQAPDRAGHGLLVAWPRAPLRPPPRPVTSQLIDCVNEPGTPSPSGPQPRDIHREAEDRQLWRDTTPIKPESSDDKPKGWPRGQRLAEGRRQRVGAQGSGWEPCAHLQQPVCFADEKMEVSGLPKVTRLIKGTAKTEEEKPQDWSEISSLWPCNLAIRGPSPATTFSQRKLHARSRSRREA